MHEQRALDCLKFIIEYKKRHDGRAPSIPEIRRKLSVGSTSTVHLLLIEMEQHRWIRRTPNIARSIEVLKNGNSDR